MAQKPRPQFKIEGARLLFPNFSGRAGRFNAEGEALGLLSPTIWLKSWPQMVGTWVISSLERMVMRLRRMCAWPYDSMSSRLESSSLRRTTMSTLMKKLWVFLTTGGTSST